MNSQPANLHLLWENPNAAETQEKVQTIKPALVQNSFRICKDSWRFVGLSWRFVGFVGFVGLRSLLFRNILKLFCNIFLNSFRFFNPKNHITEKSLDRKCLCDSQRLALFVTTRRRESSAGVVLRSGPRHLLEGKTALECSCCLKCF